MAAVRRPAAIDLLLCGGQVRERRRGLFRSRAPRRFFEEFYADKAFLGSGGVHADAGLTDYYPPEAAIRRMIIAHTGASYVLADSSKLGTMAVTGCARSTSITAVVTDDRDPGAASELQAEASDAVRGRWPALCPCNAASWPGPPARRRCRTARKWKHDHDIRPPSMKTRRCCRFGYRQQFVRTLRQFESFAVAFSFISITTGIFTTFASRSTTGGPARSGPG